MTVDELIARLREMPGDVEVQLARWTGESYRFQQEFFVGLKEVTRIDSPDEGQWEYMTADEYFGGKEAWEPEGDGPQTYAEAVEDLMSDPLQLVVFDFKDGRAVSETGDYILRFQEDARRDALLAMTPREVGEWLGLSEQGGAMVLAAIREAQSHEASRGHTHT